MAPRLAVLVAASALHWLLCGTDAQGIGVIQLDMYRAVRSADLGRTLENVELASLPGVLSYIQTEVVGEHFPQDNIPGKPGAKSPPKPLPVASGMEDEGFEGTEGAGSGWVPLSASVDSIAENDFNSEVLLDANEAMGYEEHTDPVDPVALAAGAEVVVVADGTLGAIEPGQGELLGEEGPTTPAPAAAAPAGAAPAPGAAAGEAGADDETDSAFRRRRTRTERHRGVDVVFRAEFKVKNPPALLSSKIVSDVDFGPDAQFENGEAQGKGYKWDYGAFVGAERHSDKRAPQLIPGYWFSVAGYCPNVPWDKKGSLPDQLNEDCMVHPSGKGKLLGGLCPVGGTTGAAIPTGDLDCTYSYRAPVQNSADVVSLDELAGITKEDCGGRTCRDWRDFRESCTNESYKQIFNYGRRRVLAKAKVCVEYDVHPACQSSCFDKDCLSLKETDRDMGLPFWRGRCSSAANLRRAERLAAAFQILGAQDEHQTLSLSVRGGAAAEPCIRNNATKEACRPDPESGYMYCTRQWSGVCQPCYIPGAVKTRQDAGRHLMCPWDVLQRPEYLQAAPQCRTAMARDLCCVYAGTCNFTIPADGITAAAMVPLDEDGYVAMTSLGSTKGIKDFLYRYHHELFGGEVVDEEGFTSFAYWEWGASPQTGHTFSRAIRLSRPFFVYPTSTTTATVTTVAGADTLPAGPAPAASASTGLVEPMPSDDADSKQEQQRPAPASGPTTGLYVGLAAAALLCCSGAAALFLQPRRRGGRKSRDGASLNAQSGGSRRTRNVRWGAEAEDPESLAASSPLMGEPPQPEQVQLPVAERQATAPWGALPAPPAPGARAAAAPVLQGYISMGPRQRAA